MWSRADLDAELNPVCPSSRPLLWQLYGHDKVTLLLQVPGLHSAVDCRSDSGPAVQFRGTNPQLRQVLPPPPQRGKVRQSECTGPGACPPDSLLLWRK
jgi:hypothetical protein